MSPANAGTRSKANCEHQNIDKRQGGGGEGRGGEGRGEERRGASDSQTARHGREPMPHLDPPPLPSPPVGGKALGQRGVMHLCGDNGLLQLQNRIVGELPRLLHLVVFDVSHLCECACVRVSVRTGSARSPSGSARGRARTGARAPDTSTRDRRGSRAMALQSLLTPR